MMIQRRRRPAAGLSALLLLSMSGCAGDRQRDEANLRALFRVPRDVKMTGFNGEPYVYGFTGREGLHLSAVFEFSDQQFERYAARIKERAAWKPVPFKFRSPETEAVYTEESLAWKPLPLPEPLVQSKRRQLSTAMQDQLLHVHAGMVWCTIDEFLHDRRPFYLKRYACSEKPGLDGSAFTSGVLDFSTKRLYAEYQM